MTHPRLQLEGSRVGFCILSSPELTSFHRQSTISPTMMAPGWAGFSLVCDFANTVLYARMPFISWLPGVLPPHIRFGSSDTLLVSQSCIPMLGHNIKHVEGTVFPSKTFTMNYFHFKGA